MKKIVVDREWDRSIKDWKMNGGPRPGPHPYAEHLWNTDPDQYEEEKCNPQDLFY